MKHCSKHITFFLGLNLFCVFAIGQNYYQFKGQVLDENKSPLKDAAIAIYSLDKFGVTDAQGRFEIFDLSKSSFQVEISFLGYESLRQKVTLGDNAQNVFELKKVSMDLAEVIVQNRYAENKKKESSLNVEIVNEEFLKQNLGGSLMKSIERLPGVSTIDIGSGQSKPVIRGLGFNRVVVVENNIKHEAQQWGADHGLEIDQYAIDNVEVIKGPASLMYGSDAIGGVIDLNNRNLPLKNSFGGQIDLSGKSNNDFLGTSLSLYSRKDQFFVTARATILDYGDFRVPADSVDIYSFRVPLHKNRIRNSAGREQNFHSSFGFINDKVHSRFYLSNVSSKSGFFANAHGLRPINVDNDFHDSSNRDIQFPRQEVNHFKVINKSTIWSNQWRLEFDLGYQNNFRQEWSRYVDHGFMPSLAPEDLAFNPQIERQFDKEIYSGNARFFYPISKRTDLRIGINAEYQDNDISGRGFIIPAFDKSNLGGFGFIKHKISEKSLIQAGLRYDYGNIKTDSYFDWFSSPVEGTDDSLNLQRSLDLDRNFSNFTWSLGYNYNLLKWSYKVNVGKSFRMPIAKELSANGVNYHRFSYEVGNANLSPEISYQFDAGVDYHSRKFGFGASPFFNYFTNYIYLNPTPEHDRLYGFGNQIFEYTESEVLRYGGEIYAHFDAFKFLQFGFTGEYVYAEQLSGEKKGFTLPFSPPAKGIFNSRYQNPQIGFLNDAFLSLDFIIAAAQDNIVPPEVRTDGYQVINLSLGGDVKVNNQIIDISIQVQNLLNARYFNHTSYYRLINVPEMSRNLVINISIPFSMKKEK
ncbi:MAG: TonB-dependent receptor [Bacteroidota bacterium]